jgi:hypothetical protein
MQIKKIKVGSTVELKSGARGKVLQVGGVFPPAVKVEVFYPLPQGVRWYAPRDVVREIE